MRRTTRYVLLTAGTLALIAASYPAVRSNQVVGRFVDRLPEWLPGHSILRRLFPYRWTHGNAEAALGSLRVISAAQSAYRALLAAAGQAPTYAPSLGHLADPDGDGTPSDALIDAGTASGARCGYVFQLSPASLPDGSALSFQEGWAATASPVEPGATGDVWFYTDHSGVFRYSVDGPAGPLSQPVLDPD